MNLGIMLRNRGEFHKALEQLSKGLPLLIEVGHRDGEANCLQQIAMCYSGLGEFDTAIEYFERGLELSERIGNRPGLALVNGNFANLLWTSGDLVRAMERCQIALKLNEEIGHRAGVANSVGNIGSMYGMLKEYTLAVTWLTRAMTLSEELSDRPGMLVWYENLGHAYKELNDPEKAESCFSSMLDLAEELGTADSRALAMMNLGIMSADGGDLAKAINHYRSALALAEEYGNIETIASTTMRIGSLHAQQQFNEYDPASAEELLLHAIELATQGKFQRVRNDAHRSLAELYRRLGRWEDAHYHLACHHELTVELQSIEARNTAQQLEHRRQLAEIEKQRAIEQAEADLRAQKLEAEREIERMKAEQVEKELGNTTLQLLAQTELLRDLRNDLLKIARKIPPSEPVARELRDRIKNLPCESVDWEKFDRQFKAVHPDFIRELTRRAPDLTATEVRIATMLRMNLKSHEMAQIFCISEAGVEFHRANIRRKLGLKREEKLPIVLGAM
jgi:tetratricopeptide (TPR) repeat protein/DNA-binding CsgD family transcriptional regulator